MANSKMRSIHIIVFVCSSFRLFSQSEVRLNEFKNIVQYDSLRNARIEEFEYTAYEINYIDSIFVGDSTIVIEKWSLGAILWTFLLDNPNYTALTKYLDHFNKKGIKLKLQTGSILSIPNIDEFLLAESENGYKTIWLNMTSGCLIDHKVDPFIYFVKKYNQ